MFHAALDSSIKCALVIAEDDKVLFNAELDSASRENDRKLPPWILGAVGQCGISLKDISRWTVGTGPGSFAGLRSGIAHIMGICTATGAAIRGVPSAVATAAKACPKAGQSVGVIMDGRCGEIILAVVRDGRVVGEPRALLPEDLTAPECRCDVWATPQAALLPPLPPEIQANLVAVDALDPATLLFDTAVEWPSELGAAVKSCEPIYVRPPVFVEPVKPISVL